MKRSLTLCAVALMAFAQSSVRADDIDFDLDYDTSSSTWELYAEVTGSGGADGSIGISAARALINGINFGDATIASGIGAVTASGGATTVLDLGGGLIEVLYGQDIASGPVVSGVGVGSRSLIASGGYASVPSFGSDGALVTQGLFLTSATAGTTNAIDSDSNNLSVNDVTSSGIFGDFEPDGDVDITDFGLFADAFGSVSGDANYDVRADEEPDGDVDITDFGKFADNFGIGTSSAASSVPEPTSAAIAMIALASLGLTRRRK